MQLRQAAEKHILQEPRPETGASLRIRRGGVEDIPAIVRLGIKTFGDTYGPYNDPKTMQDYLTSAFSLEKITSEMAAPTSIFLMACQGRDVIGYARLDVDQLPAGVAVPAPIRLFRLYVDRRYIGSGCGTALMKTCLSEARRSGHQTVWLGVWEQNTRAQTFYKRHGFQPVGSQAFIFGREIQKDILMARPIAPALPYEKGDEHA